jgi:hypothetical protein
VGHAERPGFFLMQGPLAVNWRAPGHPRIENASITTPNWGRPDRVRSWLDCGVHVKGRPEWLFIKLHTHGAVERDFDALFGDKAFQMHRTLNEMCNDGRDYQLHYVTARQAYNLAKAAERGLGGDPRQWLDLVVDKPATAFYALPQQHDLAACTARRLRLSNIDAAAGDATLSTTIGALRELRGPYAALDIDSGDASTPGSIEIEPRGAGALQLAFARPVALEGEFGGAHVEPADATGTRWRVQPAADGLLRLRCHERATVAA